MGYNAFEECVALEAFPFAAAVSIGDTAFKGCTALARADLTHANLSEVRDYAFEGCARLGDVVFGPAITRIGKHAFKKTLCLGDVALTKVIDIGEGAFVRSGMTRFVSGGPATLKKGACAHCPRLKMAAVKGNIGIEAFKESGLEIFVGEGYQIGRDAFEACPLRVVSTAAGKIDANVFTGSPVQVVAMRYNGEAENVQFAVHPGMFAHCSSLRKLMLPKRLHAVPHDLCRGCASLRTIRLPENVGSIGEGAFDDCASLRSVVAPRVRFFARGAFAQCPELGLVIARPGARARRVDFENDTFDNVFPHSPKMDASSARDSNGIGVWPRGMFDSTPSALMEAQSLAFWSRPCHEGCTRSQKQWVRHALLLMARLGLPSVAQLIVLSCIETANLGPTVAVNARVRVRFAGDRELGWGKVAYIGTVVTQGGERYTNRIGVELDRKPPSNAADNVPAGSFVASRFGVFAGPHGFAQGGFGPTRNGIIVDADAVVPW